MTERFHVADGWAEKDALRVSVCAEDDPLKIVRRMRFSQSKYVGRLIWDVGLCKLDLSGDNPLGGFSTCMTVLDVGCGVLSIVLTGGFKG